MSFLNNLTYRQKNLGLIIVSILMGIIVYHRAIKKSLLLSSECNMLEEKITAAQDSPERIAALKYEIRQLDKVIGDGNRSSNEIQQQLLDSISNYCKAKGMMITALPEAHEYTENDYLCVTNTVNVEGGFTDLLRLVHNLEKQFPGARPASVRFFSKKNIRTKKTKLYATIYFQNIRKV